MENLPFFATINIASMNIFIYKYFSKSISLDYIPKHGINIFKIL